MFQRNLAWTLAAALVLSVGAGRAAAQQTRTYFIAADNVEWEYAPNSLPLSLTSTATWFIHPS